MERAERQRLPDQPRLAHVNPSVLVLADDEFSDEETTAFKVLRKPQMCRAIPKLSSCTARSEHPLTHALGPH